MASYAIGCFTLQSALLQKSPEVFASCYQVEGIRQSSRGRLHIYYLPYDLTSQPGDVTLVAQFSMDRLGVCYSHCSLVTAKIFSYSLQ